MMMIVAVCESSVVFGALCALMLGWHRPPIHGWSDTAAALGVAGAFTLNAISALYYADCYELRVVPNLGRFVSRLPRSIALALVPLVGWHMLHPHSRMALIASGLLMIGVLPVLRAAFYHIRRLQPFVKRVLIVGSNPQAYKVVEAIEQDGSGRYTIVGVADDAGGVGEPLSRYPVVGPLHRLEKIIEATRPDRIVVALQDRRGRLPVPPLLEARLCGIVVEEGAELYERLTGKIAIESLTPSSLIFSPAFRPPALAMAVGRTLSLAVAVVGLVALAPLFALIALLIRSDSAGPVFFVQERVGLGGRRFNLIKFRTMHVTGAAISEWACDNSDRITRVGYWLRRFRLDELPQFVNILRGDMDLVGPRPHPATNFSLFVTVLRNSPECGQQIPYYSLRSLARPGITGWAQVRYRYANNLEEEIEKVRYDLYYVKHRSLWLDLRILADTVKTVVSGRGAVDLEAPPIEGRIGAAPVWELAANPEQADVRLPGTKAA
ncbi:MAG TPA: sugar transferase [Methylomirabilota bacterium]|jgi:exopolysaccharide biosynthesis polyprenyl glycosylphosphotransferase|nr:sugar transferase [Methylomirabilota bacterium]